jgi:hypothetical protein
MNWPGMHTACWLAALRILNCVHQTVCRCMAAMRFSQLAEGHAQIHSIEISDRHLFGSSERVSLTGTYRTTFSVAGDPALREATGSHRWELRKQDGRWLVFLVSWSATTDQLDRA